MTFRTRSVIALRETRTRREKSTNLAVTRDDAAAMRLGMLRGGTFLRENGIRCHSSTHRSHERILTLALKS